MIIMIENIKQISYKFGTKQKQINTNSVQTLINKAYRKQNRKTTEGKKDSVLYNNKVKEIYYTISVLNLILKIGS